MIEILPNILLLLALVIFWGLMMYQLEKMKRIIRGKD